MVSFAVGDIIVTSDESAESPPVTRFKVFDSAGAIKGYVSLTPPLVNPVSGVRSDPLGLRYKSPYVYGVAHNIESFIRNKGVDNEVDTVYAYGGNETSGSEVISGMEFVRGNAFWYYDGLNQPYTMQKRHLATGALLQSIVWNSADSDNYEGGTLRLNKAQDTIFFTQAGFGPAQAIFEYVMYKMDVATGVITKFDFTSALPTGGINEESHQMIIDKSDNIWNVCSFELAGDDHLLLVKMDLSGNILDTIDINIATSIEPGLTFSWDAVDFTVDQAYMWLLNDGVYLAKVDLATGSIVQVVQGVFPPDNFTSLVVVKPSTSTGVFGTVIGAT